MEKNNEILVLGDSHAEIFNFWLLRKLLNKYYFKVVSIHGATISGIENPNSKTQSHFLFNKAINEYSSKPKKCIVLLGEVDTGFVLWHKHENNKIPIDELLELTIDKYYQFLKKLKYLNFEVTVISTPLPTIKDDCNWGEVANLRKSIKANQNERTSLTLIFNNRVRSLCLDSSFANYIMLDDLSLNLKSGVVKNILRNFSKRNHHYNSLVYSYLIYKKLRNVKI